MVVKKLWDQNANKNILQVKKIFSILKYIFDLQNSYHGIFFMMTKKKPLHFGSSLALNHFPPKSFKNLFYFPHLGCKVFVCCFSSPSRHQADSSNEFSALTSSPSVFVWIWYTFTSSASKLGQFFAVRLVPVLLCFVFVLFRNPIEQNHLQKK